MLARLKDRNMKKILLIKKILEIKKNDLEDKFNEGYKGFND